MSLFWTITFLTLTFSNIITEAKHQKKLPPSAVIVGTVYCDTCFHQDFSKSSHFISGASVAVECKDTTPGFRQEVKTNKNGEFQVHLPFSVSKHVKKIKGCSVKLVSSNEPFCAVAATATSSNLHLKSRKSGTHIFSAGFFTFKPLKQPEVCDQKPIINHSFKKTEKLSPISNPNDPTFLPPIQDPPSDPPGLGNYLPPLLPPLPQLPRLPVVLGIPLLPPLPKKETDAKESQFLDKKVNQPMSFPFPPNPFNPPNIFPPNPFQPPPSVLPPNPFQPPSSVIPPNPFQPPSSVIPPVLPSPPPSLFPPLFPTPSSPPFFRLPPIPGLLPSPPPPTPPTSPIPLPQFPFQPTPGFPGGPPAKVSSQSKTRSP
ncbi:hypothetical protein ACJIZ3_001974 [Penstemon smallii]|uniref:Uncharacterized protein n=1 Tax=Penstemon smallii TaxID=265156 RepID=A0ABD3U6N3_9LAMI